MGDTYFQAIAGTEDTVGDTAGYLAGPATTGPWSAALQHGGPPNALAVEVAATAVARATGRDDLVALRLAAEFTGPVPVGEIQTRVQVVRAARSAALASVVVSAGGRDCLHTRVWFVRAADTAAIASVATSDPRSDPLSFAEVPAGIGTDFGYGDSIEWRYVSGAMNQPGPGVTWARPRLPLLPGHEMSGLARVALLADSASGISSELDWTEWTFLNVDLDLHLARPLVGDWVLLDATTQLGAHGSALARSTISDRDGVAGAGLQTLILAPQRP